jgi:hypothetical protein
MAVLRVLGTWPSLLVSLLGRHDVFAGANKHYRSWLAYNTPLHPPSTLEAGVEAFSANIACHSWRTNSFRRVKGLEFVQGYVHHPSAVSL